MTVDRETRRINWYRTPVRREDMNALLHKSDAKGLAQTLGQLGLLALTSAAAWVAAGRLPAAVLILVLLVHGTIYAFLLNGFHELCHKTVFKTRWLNTFFLYLVSFISWNNPVFFWTSHQEHHKYTLHPPDDQEVVLPIRLTLKDFLKSAVVNPWDFWGRLKTYTRHSRGQVQGTWESALFPPSNLQGRRALFNWARFHLAGHLLLLVVSIIMGWWLLPVLVTLAPFYGGWLLFLCNNTQHIGLRDRVPDFRLCCRTIYLNPFVQFIYWNMNYHTEHHMFAAIPCYNLQRLHQLIKDDLPPCPRGLAATWKQINEIQNRQQIDPSYQYDAPLPVRAKP